MAQAALAAGQHGEGMAVWRATLAGLSASLVGIGLARFAYAPLIPALIAAGWMSPGAAAYIGAANLAGYLAGAVLARPMAARFPVAAVLRAMMLLATVSFFACAFPLSFWWFFVWRGAAGIAGGALMVLAAPAVLPLVPAARRGLASGVMFTGIGIGVVLSGTLVPVLLQSGLVATWCGIGTLALAMTVAGWRGWPAAPAAIPGVTATAPGQYRVTRRAGTARCAVPSLRDAQEGAPSRAGTARCAVPSLRDAQEGARSRAGIAVLALYLAYALDASGIVPHMVFLADFVARGLDQGIAAGAHAWVLFGLGAAIGRRP